MLEGCDKYFICGRKEKKIQDEPQSKVSEALPGFFIGNRNDVTGKWLVCS